MSEVEKLYKNAGVKKQYDYIGIKENYNGKIRYTKRAVLEKVEQFKNKTLRIIDVCPFYPDFIAEKQIELIKWLASRKIYEQTDYLNLGIWSAFGEYAIGIGVESFNDRLGFDLAEKGETFEICLAKLINNLWQDLTEQERTEIRSILECC